VFCVSFTAVTLSWILTTILAGHDRGGQSRNCEANRANGRPGAAKRTGYAYFCRAFLHFLPLSDGSKLTNISCGIAATASPRTP